jgi:hypothetical protein
VAGSPLVGTLDFFKRQKWLLSCDFCCNLG